MDTTNKPKDDPVYHPSVLLKFHDDIPSFPYEVGAERYFEEYQLGSWKEIAGAFPGITLRPKFSILSPSELAELIEKAESRDHDYQAPNFLTYYMIDVPPEYDPNKLVDYFRQWDAVQAVYVESPPTPGPGVNPDDDVNINRQGYLEAHAPSAVPPTNGVDARYAWGFPGGDGSGITIVDLEQGWYLNHEDLPSPPIDIITGIDIDNVPDSYFFSPLVPYPVDHKQKQRAHGTNTLGVIVGVDNDKGVVGIAPHASAQAASIWRQLEDPPGSGLFFYSWNMADAILGAVANLEFGDILLLEVQLWCDVNNPLPCSGKQFEPIELEKAIFDSIRLATALGIIVIEAAGNGSFQNGAFDLKNRMFRGTNLHPLDFEKDDEFEDSGAILVGAATKTYPYHRLDANSPTSPFIGTFSPSNYGTRVNCFAWGQGVFTTGQSGGIVNIYEAFYNSTSSASAIIAGVAAVVQGLAEHHTVPAQRLSPFAMRALLSNKAFGVESDNPAVDLIGVMPDLRKIIDTGLNITPDI